MSIDVVGLVDEWAARFFEELDYVNEGENGTYFADVMKEDLPQVITLVVINLPCGSGKLCNKIVYSIYILYCY